MGALFSSLWGLVFFSSREYKVVMVGLDNAGKTTILYQLLHGQAVQTTPTIGSNVEEFNYKNLKFLLWDVGGQQTLRNTWSTYYVHTDALFLIIDSSDDSRLELLIPELTKILGSEALKEAALLVLANKMDVPNALDSATICERLDLPRVMKGRNWKLQPCCALTGEGLGEGLDWLVHQISSSGTGK